MFSCDTIDTFHQCIQCPNDKKHWNCFMENGENVAHLLVIGQNNEMPNA